MRWVVVGVALFLASNASAQTAQPLTGSPSNGTSTVSPSSVSQAIDRPASVGSSVALSLGTSIATGDYGGAADASIWSEALGVRFATAGFQFSGSIPYMRVRSRATIFTGIDSTPVVVTRGVSGPRVLNSGLGDLTLGTSYTTPQFGNGFEVEISGRVKVPTAAASSRLSTGQADYSGGVQVTKTIGNLAPFVSATYRIFGDAAGFNLRDGFAASAGASYIVGSRVVLLGSYHYARSASPLVDDSHEMFAGVSAPLGQSRLRLTAFITKGLSSGAANASGGLALAWRLQG